MHKNISMAGLFEDTVQMPSGIVVPRHSAADLIKSEAKKQRLEDNKSALFSKFFLASNMIAAGAREKPLGTPHFAVLYEAARKSFIDAILIQSRVDQQKRVWQKAREGKTKEVGFRVVHDRYDDPDYVVSKNDKERCHEMEQLLNNPTPVEHTWLYPHNIRPHHNLKDLASVLTRAELIIDRKVILRYKRQDGQGYAAFHWLPGESIKNVDESIRAWAIKNEKDGQVTKDTISRMSHMTGFDIARSSYVQMIDGMITAAFTDDEISVHISNPSDQMNRFGYGTSRLELSLDITTTLLMAFTYNREMFKTNYPEQVLTVAGDFDKEGLAAFKQQVLSEAGGVGANWRLPVIPAGDTENFKIESVKLRETPKDMLFDQMIELAINLKAAAYGAHPSTLNLSAYAGTSGQSSLGSINNASDIEFSKEHGLIPSLTDMCDWLTDCMVKPRYDDLKLVLEGLDPEDERESVDLRTQRTSKWMTRNEARIEEGREPIGDLKDPANMWNMPADAPIMSQLVQQGAAEQKEQEQQQDQGDDGDDYGGYDYDYDYGGESEDEDTEYQKSLRKSRTQPDKKYLKITIN